MALQALGMNYPLQRGQQGYFDAVYDTFDNERVKLINLMNTVEGERIMQPDFGLLIERYLFEEISQDIALQIKAHVQNKIDSWLPNIRVSSINVKLNTPAGANRNSIFIEIIYALTADPMQLDSMTFQF